MSLYFSLYLYAKNIFKVLPKDIEKQRGLLEKLFKTSALYLTLERPEVKTI